MPWFNWDIDDYVLYAPYKYLNLHQEFSNVLIFRYLETQVIKQGKKKYPGEMCPYVLFSLAA